MGKPYQWHFEIKDLIPDKVNIDRLWIINGKLFLEKKGENLYAFLLGDEDEALSGDKAAIINSYLQLASLLSYRAPALKDLGGRKLKSKSEFGDNTEIYLLFSKLQAVYPDEAIAEIQNHVPKYLLFWETC